MFYENPPLKETSKHYVTGADTVIPAFTRVNVLADRDDGTSLVRWEGTISCFQIDTDLLRDVYKEDYPVKKGEDPLESREFYERCQRYRICAAGRQERVIHYWEELKDFIGHHYVQRKDK